MPLNINPTGSVKFSPTLYHKLLIPVTLLLVGAVIMSDIQQRALFHHNGISAEPPTPSHFPSEV